ncbi:MAG: YchJ family metal-binding protein [Pseudomonadota bacterium]
MKIVECPCGGKRYATCCGRYLDGIALAPDAEALMRSRYVAYVRHNDTYLRATWDPKTCPVGGLVEQPAPKWIALQVLSHREEGDAATVEFIARYKIGGRAHRLYEVSRFVRKPTASGEMAWLYVDGSFPGAHA